MLLSVLVPVYNGAPYLERCLGELVNTLNPKSYAWEVIVCEDGSTDGTKQLCATLRTRYPQVRFINSDKRLGRGGALNRAMEDAKGDIVAYVDVDMATDARHLDDLVRHAGNGSDVVIGSRYAPGSKSRRSFGRRAYSLVYNALIRSLFRSRIRDHQCGFKAFKREALEAVLPRVHSRHWFWDTEVLVHAQAMGLRVSEIPVDWEENPDHSTMNMRKDVPYFVREIVALRREMRKQRNT
ncbi:MAG TPA: dolichyl-phosphate beta-glucosyltransferase [Candidatus Thermoplasmatota archaeon]